MTTATMPTEAVTYYAFTNAAGKVTAVTNEYGAATCNGSAVTVTMPTADAIRDAITAIPGAAVPRPGMHDPTCWTVCVDRPVLGTYPQRFGPDVVHYGTAAGTVWTIEAEIRRTLGWRVSVAPSGGCVYVWPPVSERVVSAVPQVSPADAS